MFASFWSSQGLLSLLARRIRWRKRSLPLAIIDLVRRDQTPQNAIRSEHLFCSDQQVKIDRLLLITHKTQRSGRMALSESVSVRHHYGSMEEFFGFAPSQLLGSIRRRYFSEDCHLPNENSSSSRKKKSVQMTKNRNTNEDQEKQQQQQQQNDTKSFVKRGTEFELLSVSVLKQHGFKIYHTGGPADEGIDFQGGWIFPHEASQKIQVIGQCKHQEKSKISSKVIRELEGVLAKRSHLYQYPTYAAKVSWSANEKELVAVGVLVSNRGFTTAAKQRHLNSKFPIINVVISTHDQAKHNQEKEEERAASIEQFSLNPAAQQTLPGLDVGISCRGSALANKKTITLFHKGHEIQHIDECT